MRLYGGLFLALAAAFLALFGVARALDLPLLADPGARLSAAGSWGTAALGFALLVVDVFLPVPSSLVMVAHGALLGALPGAAVSLAGGLGAAAVGFACGRWGRAPLRRRLADGERERADRLLRRWGALAVVVSRPVPILAEAVAVVAGASPLGWRRYLLAAAAGNLPAAVLYALAGATARRLDDALLAFGLVLAVAGLVWLGGVARGRWTAPHDLSEGFDR